MTQSDQKTLDQTQHRYYFMDNLRAVAMLIGIFFHAALAYSPYIHNVWYVADPAKSMVLDFFVSISHLFRMPLFFLISGCDDIDSRSMAE